KNKPSIKITKITITSPSIYCGKIPVGTANSFYFLICQTQLIHLAVYIFSVVQARIDFMRQSLLWKNTVGYEHSQWSRFAAHLQKEKFRIQHLIHKMFHSTIC